VLLLSRVDLDFEEADDDDDDFAAHPATPIISNMAMARRVAFVVIIIAV